MDRNRTSSRGPVPSFVGTVRNVSNGTLKGSSITLGKQRPFRQERQGKQRSCFIEAAASRPLASSWIWKCWIAPDTPGKAWGFRLHVVHTKQPVRVESDMNVPLPAGNSDKGRLLPALDGKRSRKEAGNRSNPAPSRGRKGAGYYRS